MLSLTQRQTRGDNVSRALFHGFMSVDTHQGKVMSKAAIAGMLAEQLGLKKADGIAVVDTVLKGIESVLLSQGSITFVGFGSFTLTERKPRRARDIASGKTIELPARTVVKFTPGAMLKEAVDTLYPPAAGTAKASPKKR